jgi:NAD(P)-dependent dehydrogenase (short-subunit alcohol dehydrogenase family)
MYNLKDRKVLVTGASRGLGAAIAMAFAEEGCDLAITYLGSRDKADSVADEIRSFTGRRVVIFQAVSIVIEDQLENFFLADVTSLGIVSRLRMRKNC